MLYTQLSEWKVQKAKRFSCFFIGFLNLQVIHMQRETCLSSLLTNTQKEVQNQNEHEPVKRNKAKEPTKSIKTSEIKAPIFVKSEKEY